MTFNVCPSWSFYNKIGATPYICIIDCVKNNWAPKLIFHRGDLIALQNVRIDRVKIQQVVETSLPNVKYKLGFPLPTHKTP